MLTHSDETWFQTFIRQYKETEFVDFLPEPKEKPKGLKFPILVDLYPSESTDFHSDLRTISGRQGTRNKTQRFRS